MDDRTHTDNGVIDLHACVCDPLDGTEQLLARDVMQCGVVSIDRREPVQKAVMLLLDRNISGLPVTDNGRLDGMLSEKDLLELWYESRYLPGLVEEYMTCGATSFDVETELTVIHRHLVENFLPTRPHPLSGSDRRYDHACRSRPCLQRAVSSSCPIPVAAGR